MADASRGYARRLHDLADDLLSPEVNEPFIRFVENETSTDLPDRKVVT